MAVVISRRRASVYIALIVVAWLAGAVAAVATVGGTAM